MDVPRFRSKTKTQSHFPVTVPVSCPNSPPTHAKLALIPSTGAKKRPRVPFTGTKPSTGTVFAPVDGFPCSEFAPVDGICYKNRGRYLDNCESHGNRNWTTGTFCRGCKQEQTKKTERWFPLGRRMFMPEHLPPYKCNESKRSEAKRSEETERTLLVSTQSGTTTLLLLTSVTHPHNFFGHPGQSGTHFFVLYVPEQRVHCFSWCCHHGPQCFFHLCYRGGGRLLGV